MKSFFTFLFSFLLSTFVQAQNAFQFEAAQFPESGLTFLAVPQVCESSCAGTLKTRNESVSAQFLRLGDESFLVFVLPQSLVERSQTEVLKFHFEPGKATDSTEVPARKIPELLTKLFWEDRVFNPNGGAWLAANDKNPTEETVADGPFCTVTRRAARFCRPNGSFPPGEPTAVYDWFQFKTADAPILVRARIEQKTAVSWKEIHLGELHFHDAFPLWAGTNAGSETKGQSGNLSEAQNAKLGEKPGVKPVEKPGVNQGEKIRIPFSRGACVSDGKTVVSMYAPEVLFYGDLVAKRVYLLSHSTLAWKPFEGLKSDARSFLLKVQTLNEGETPENVLVAGQTTLQPKYFRLDSTWETRPKAAGEAWTVENADLKAELDLTRNPDGTQSLAVNAVADARTGFLFTQEPQELFSVEVEQTETRARTTFTSRSVWREIVRSENALTFSGPNGFETAPDLTVRVTLNPEEKLNAGPETSRIPAFGFHLSVATNSPKVRPLTAAVGMIQIGNTGPAMMGLHPGGCGTLVPNPASGGQQISGAYPSMNAVMPWLAVWDPDRKTGLYFANLDASGAAKTVKMRNPGESSVARLEIAQPLPIDPKDCGKEVAYAGTLVWQRLDGDWYTASVRYRDWVRRNAGWFPKMGPEGRVSTPLWMKQLCAWGRVFGYAKDAVPQGIKFQETLGIPVGVHWYKWHAIPFDDDYPHYLPPKEGFKEGVEVLHAYGIRVVPYTNGRLWDTRDRGTEDWEFTSRGLAGATKKADGTPFTESYRSLEKDGSKVVLAAMCPGSTVWKEQVAETNRRLIREYGLDGVYMDQIACCGPVLCEDPTHGHPLRGGDWWTNEYRKLLLDAKQAILAGGEKETRENSKTHVNIDSPKPFIFSSESNAETCANDLDGMVCWHIEGKNVPAYCVTYAGVVFPYGRAYDSNTRAMRMKWANNLCNGDQLGWFPPAFLEDPELRDYLRPLVRFRFHSVPYFYLGELNRPPRLTGENLPTWSENWNVFGRFSVNTMLTVQTAARRILDYEYDAEGNRLWDSGKVRSALLVFTNYSHEDVTSPVEIDWADLGIDPEKAVFQRVDSEGRKTPLTLRNVQSPILFPAGETWGIEVQSGIVHHRLSNTKLVP